MAVGIDRCSGCSHIKLVNSNLKGWCGLHPELGVNDDDNDWGIRRDSIIIRSFGCADFEKRVE